MEKTSENVVTDTPQHHDEPKDRPRKKKPGPIQVISVALLKMGKRSSESPKSRRVDDDGSKSKRNSNWSKFVGSMRPMHLQETQSPRSSPRIDNGDRQSVLQLSVPPSPSEYSTDGGDGSLYSPSPSSSKYASAVGLNEMVKGDEEGEIKQENDNVARDGGDGDGDEMIDAKAEEFIANFYNQMKLQRMDTMDRLCKERNQRSLGW